jgi:predicted nucleic acid-binding protein
MEEVERVLLSHKFGLSKSEVTILLNPVFSVAEIIIPKCEINIIKRCPGDNRVLECAIDGACEYIVTGDRRDLLSLDSIGTTRIISAKEFLDILK